MRRRAVAAPVQVKPQLLIILGPIDVASVCPAQIAARGFRWCAASRLLTGRPAPAVELTGILRCDFCHRESYASVARDSTNLPRAGPGRTRSSEAPTPDVPVFAKWLSAQQASDKARISRLTLRPDGL